MEINANGAALQQMAESPSGFLSPSAPDVDVCASTSTSSAAGSLLQKLPSREKKALPVGTSMQSKRDAPMGGTNVVSHMAQR
jgi:hypothetical protein